MRGKANGHSASPSAGGRRRNSPRAGQDSRWGRAPSPARGDRGQHAYDGEAGAEPEPLQERLRDWADNSHTAILFRKNALIKKRQYASVRRCLKVPVPMSFLMEYIVPVLVVLLVTWLKTLTDFDVITDGWGGDTPTGSRSTTCVRGLEYRFNPALTSAAGLTGVERSMRTTDCTPYSVLVTQPEPFFKWVSLFHWTWDARMGMSADREEDVPKLQRMREWISANWYPRHRMQRVHGCRDGQLQDYPFGRSGPMNRKFSEKECKGDNVVISSFSDVTHVHGGGTTAEMMQYLQSSRYGVDGPKYAFAVVFHSIPGDGSPGSAGDWDYSVRMNYTFGDIGGTLFWPVRPLARGISDWYQNSYDMQGFKSVQLLFDRYIINKRADIGAAAVLSAAPGMMQDWNIIERESSATREILAEPMRYAPQIVQTVPMPLHGYILNSFYEIVKAVFALLFLLMYMYPTFSMIATFIEEKESRVREGMRMMGVQNGSLLLSWFLLHFALFLLLNIVLTVACGYSIFEFSSHGVILVFLQLYSISAVAFAYMIHCFFDKARTGAVAGALVFNCCYFVYASTFDISAGNIRPGGSLSVVLLSPAAFSFGVSILAQYEEAGVGAHWANIGDDIGTGVTLGSIFLMLIVDTALYTFLGWYLDQVLPKEFGVRQPYGFLFRKSYWYPEATDGWFGRPKEAAARGSLLDGSFSADSEQQGFEHVEEVSADLRAQETTDECVQIRGLRKVFDTPDGEKVAVRNLHVNIYANQIFALLGHNGAGKTTSTRAMLPISVVCVVSQSR